MEIWEYKEYIDKKLMDNLPLYNQYNETIYQGMKYSLEIGGKRIRPIMTFMAYELFKKDFMDIEKFACGIEYIHTYSLVHDDLPVMDNDDFRRGKPTSHKVFGEGQAVLIGDSLLTSGITLLLDCPGDMSEEEVLRKQRVLEASRIMIEAVSLNGMIGGQSLDLNLDGGKRSCSSEELDYIHKNKTGALIAASLVCGGILGGATEEEYLALKEYGEITGLIFQIMDDILDQEGSFEELGKDVGSDAKNMKATYTSLYGIDEAKKVLAQLKDKSLEILNIFGNRKEKLVKLSEYLIQRSK